MDSYAVFWSITHFLLLKLSLKTSVFQDFRTKNDWVYARNARKGSNSAGSSVFSVNFLSTETKRRFKIQGFSV